MDIEKKGILLFIIFISQFGFSQVFYNIDFGSANSGDITPGNWNNITSNASAQSGINANLISSIGTSSSIILTITDAFNFVNTNGTSTSSLYYVIPPTATQDSFFGNTSPFSGYIEPTGGFVLSGLNPAKYYSFSIFASRTGVSDNRETLYTATGNTTISGTLNPSNNTSNLSELLNINPLPDGTISFSATVGPNNTNANGFFYLGAIRLIESDTPYSPIPDPSSLSLTYPNGGEIWEVGKTPKITWVSQNNTFVTLEYSTNDGSNWNSIATVLANSQSYTWTIPNEISDLCKVRITSGTLSDSSETNFSIIPNVGTTYKIVVLGSSTAAGTGPTSVNNAWVWMYRDYLTQHDTRYVVENLALGGYTTYNILPTGTTIPTGVSQAIDLQRNITKAIQLNANGIIVNMPSNDSANNYSAANQIANYHLIQNTATAQNIPLWIASPQPRNFGNATQTAIQFEVLNTMPSEFDPFTFDFWTTLAQTNGNINPIYNVDGVHLNNAGHLILLDRVIGKGIHTAVKNLVDASLSTSDFVIDSNFMIYPNPTNNELNINYFLKSDSIIKISIYDLSGKLISIIKNERNTAGNQTFQLKINQDNSLTKGIYFCKIESNQGTITKKIILQ